MKANKTMYFAAYCIAYFIYELLIVDLIKAYSLSQFSNTAAFIHLFLEPFLTFAVGFAFGKIFVRGKLSNRSLLTILAALPFILYSYIVFSYMILNETYLLAKFSEVNDALFILSGILASINTKRQDKEA